MITVNGNTVATYSDNQNVYPQVIALFRFVQFSTLLSDPFSSSIPYSSLISSVSSVSLPASTMLTLVAPMPFASHVPNQAVIYEDTVMVVEEAAIAEANTQQAISAIGRCGESEGGVRCKGGDQMCCSRWQWCGNDAEWCTDGCQVRFGRCW